MNEILTALIFSMILGLFYLIKFDKICIIVSVITLLIANYIYDLDKAVVNIDIFLLWTILFYILIIKILHIFKSSTLNK